MMLLAAASSDLPDSVYSSWPLVSADDLHGQHRGRLMATRGASKSTLDDFLDNAGLAKVDFIKLDVDGNEANVLTGARRIIESARPRIMLELAPYVYRDDPGQFDGLLESLWASGYRIHDVATGRPLPTDAAAVRNLIPAAGGLNALATHGI